MTIPKLFGFLIVTLLVGTMCALLLPTDAFLLSLIVGAVMGVIYWHIVGVV